MYCTHVVHVIIMICILMCGACVMVRMAFAVCVMCGVCRMLCCVCGMCVVYAMHVVCVVRHMCMYGDGGVVGARRTLGVMGAICGVRLWCVVREVCRVCCVCGKYDNHYSIYGLIV